MVRTRTHRQPRSRASLSGGVGWRAGAGLLVWGWRGRPLRSTVTAMGVAIAIAALFSLLAFQQGYREGVRHELDRLGAHVLVVPKGCPYDAASMALHGASWPCHLQQSYLQEVRSTPGVAAAAPLFMAALYDAGGVQTVYLGADTTLLSFKRAWRITGRFPARDGELLAGSEAARRNRWHVGQQVPLPGLPGQRGTVAGILAPTGGAEDSFIHLPLADAQRRFRRTNELSHILVRLADPNDVDRVVAALRGCDAGLAMNVVPLAHLFHTLQSLVNITRLLLGCWSVLAFLVAGAGVSNALLMAVTERSREIGVLRAVGASRAQVFALVGLESVQLCLVGGLLGLGAGLAGARLVEAWVRARLPFAPAETLLEGHWWLMGTCLGVTLLLGVGAALLPAWRAASVSPLRAIRMGGRPA